MRRAAANRTLPPRIFEVPRATRVVHGEYIQEQQQPIVVQAITPPIEVIDLEIDQPSNVIDVITIDDPDEEYEYKRPQILKSDPRIPLESFFEQELLTGTQKDPTGRVCYLCHVDEELVWVAYACQHALYCKPCGLRADRGKFLQKCLICHKTSEKSKRTGDKEDVQRFDMVLMS
jgi:hypothetical protein